MQTEFRPGMSPLASISRASPGFGDDLGDDVLGNTELELTAAEAHVMRQTGSILMFFLLILATPCLAQGIEEGERVRLRVDSPVRYGGYTTIMGHFVDVREDAIRL
ncbi:MAG: hypothetical protein ACODAA_08155 [Gemmatimonadota bacterium]